MIEIPNLQIGQYAVAILLPLILGLIYKFIPVIPDSKKPLITMGFAIVLAILSLYYEPSVEPITIKKWIDTIIAGILIGAQAVGVYEGARAVYNPRE